MWLLLLLGAGAYLYAKRDVDRTTSYAQYRDDLIQALARVAASEIPDASSEAKYQAMLAVLRDAGSPDQVRAYVTADTGRFGPRERYSGRRYSTASAPTEADLSAALRVFRGPNHARYPEAGAFTHSRTPAEVRQQIGGSLRVVGQVDQIELWG